MLHICIFLINFATVWHHDVAYILSVNLIRISVMLTRYKNRISSQLLQPMQQFMQQEKAGGIVLAVSVVIALILANSPLRQGYAEFFLQHFGLVFNDHKLLYFSLEHWINDGLMSMFFFVVGLELKREFIGGELRDLRNVLMPVSAALFGMLFPALIYLLFNHSTAYAGGWGIPMATDIAFALAVIYLLGDKIPTSAKVFLTTLAIVDDLGAVVVIALFYTSDISLINILIGFLFLGLMFMGNKLGIKNVWFYGVLGIGGVWLAFLMSGVHATIAAVLSALVIPADSKIPEAAFITRIKKQITLFEDAEGNDVRTLEPEQVEIISQVKSSSIGAIPPLQRLEHSMHPLVSFVIMPVFALGNAGVSFVDMDLSQLADNFVSLGVMLGLLLGKPLGIVCGVLLITVLGLAQRPAVMTWRRVIGLGFLASIGFTMSMFVTTLAFSTPMLYVQAKVGIFAASVSGGLIGYWLLNSKKAKN